MNSAAIVGVIHHSAPGRWQVCLQGQIELTAAGKARAYRPRRFHGPVSLGGPMQPWWRRAAVARRPEAFDPIGLAPAQIGFGYACKKRRPWIEALSAGLLCLPPRGLRHQAQG